MTSDDDRGAKAVRALMARVELPPSRLDIDRAVRTGRRGRRWRQILTAAGAAATVAVGSGAVVAGVGAPQGPDRPVVTPSPTATPVACTVTVLPAPEGYRPVSLVAADATGRHLVGNALQDGTEKVRVVVWVDESPTTFEVPGAGPFTDPTDVNSAGTVVGGASGTASGRTFAWSYRNGTVTKLPNPSGYRAGGPAFINERGDIAAPASGATGLAVVVWPASAPDRPRVFPTSFADLDLADIAEDGTVVGSVGADDPRGFAVTGNGGTPYAWPPDGVGRELAVPAGWDGGLPRGVHGDWVLGSVYASATTRDRPFGATFAPARWRLSTGEVELRSAITADSMMPIVDAVTETGWMSVQLSEQKTALLGPDGQVLFPRNRDGVEAARAQAAWVGDGGRTIVANSDFAPDFRRPAKWRCEAG
ncbi:hypothetical protein [Phytohabitans houttuyneae]|uniref:Runt domain-containing protein n=1 Tax=Phytohabitans houttuyneae TaxID=1076126 RepID=A0A6V8KHG9_9ACTN|nr:hypothetical protein [Phytohabitans houttuyneae]GFJ81549.1 hypothetical protein Phou_057290 [Phytohabitans houttuyneae]